LTLPKLSIAAKLYAIFALMATVTVALAAVAVLEARQHERITNAFEAAFIGGQNVERVNAMIYAVIMESRGISLASNPIAAQENVEALRKINDRISATVADWQTQIGPDESAQFSNFAVRISQFQSYVEQTMRLGTERNIQEARRWSEDEANRLVRQQLSADLEALSEHYATRARRVYGDIEYGVQRTAWLMTILAVLTLLLGGVGALVMQRHVARPLQMMTGVTERVAAGDSAVAVPFSDRGDEIGALARSIGVFQQAMRRNEELNRTVFEDAEQRTRRQEAISGEIARFSADVEATLSELGRISDQMLEASTQLAGAADAASAKTARAEEASAEASNNVRDIASAADELSASVNEIDRQVAQSNAIASKAVNEAGRTNLAVKELDEAASRIGDVVKLITDIAEQTNLLALNATIEAARAGEAGRGFAVVAGEVKALAGQTSRATEEIGAQIAGMQRATTRSIEAITAIEHTIREIGNISSAIAAAVTEQGAATSEIARSVEIAARRTVETAAEVNQVGAATTDTRASAGAVKSVADDLGSVAGRIRAQVDQFFERLSA
jgi:methyl-accepting chemotaxis protein